MEIERLHIRAYRSLWDVELEPKPFRVVVGANNAGKTNLLDAIHFLGEVHRHGTDIAVSRKGGYENIAFRQKRRTKRPVAFLVSAIADLDELIRPYVRRRTRGAVSRQDSPGQKRIRITHSFALKAESQAIGADYSVHEEQVLVEFESVESEYHPLISVDRSRDDFTISVHESVVEEQEILRVLVDPMSDSGFKDFVRRNLEPTDLALTSMRFSEVFRYFSSELSQTRLYQLAPVECRRPGVPTPSPELDLHGGNLPAVVGYLRKHHPKAWHEVERSMRSVIPRLLDIRTDYTSDRRLALLFAEDGFDRPWSSEDISDGTMQSLALFCALFDPRSRLTLIEEPENSVHPWIIRKFVDACRRASSKQVLVTTHSPVLVDHLRPDEVEIAWRAQGRTHVAPLIELDPEADYLWSQGRNTVFELIDSGSLEQAVPGGVE